MEVKELYVGSPENRKSWTICETIQANGKFLPAFIIAPGIKIMDNWINPELGDDGNDNYLTQTPTGYTSNEKIMEYLDHFIKHSGAGPNAHWRLLLCDGHSTHEFEDFKLKAYENHIVVYTLPSHETQALQPLDAKCFAQ
jgi:hypothetical protein